MVLQQQKGADFLNMFWYKYVFENKNWRIECIYVE